MRGGRGSEAGAGGQVLGNVLLGIVHRGLRDACAASCQIDTVAVYVCVGVLCKGAESPDEMEMPGILSSDGSVRERASIRLARGASSPAGRVLRPYCSNPLYPWT